MRAVVQRVSSASVTIDGDTAGAIEAGLLVYLAVAPDDGDAEVAWIARKLAELRIFADPRGGGRVSAEGNAERMSRSVEESGGAVLLISQFTLYADTRKAAAPRSSPQPHPRSPRHSSSGAWTRSVLAACASRAAASGRTCWYTR